MILDIYNKILEFDDIIILRHKRPDFDAIGSQMALKGMLELNFPDKNIIAYGDNGYDDFNFIGSVDNATLDLFKKALVIVVDTANAIRIEGEYYKSAKYLIKIDHHIDVEEDRYADINLVDSNMSSTCEFLYYFYENIKNNINSDFIINEEIAQYLFMGIYSDTGGFVFPNTRSFTFYVLSNLREYNFDYEATIDFLKLYDYKIIKVVGYLYQNINITNGVGYFMFDKELQNKLGVLASDVSIIVNFLGSIRELQAWVIFNEYDNFIRVNLRSRARFDISKVANKYGGGGHKNASGATIHSFDKVDDIVADLLEMVE